MDNSDIGPAWNDRADSLRNRTDKNVCVWSDATYRDLNWIIEPGQKQELLYLYDNAVTSIEVHYGYGYGCGG